MTLGELKEAIDALVSEHPANADRQVLIVPGYDDWREILAVTLEADVILIDTDDRNWLVQEDSEVGAAQEPV